MPLVTTPDGDTFEETNPTALHYYGREPGFKVRDAADAEARPAKSASKADWLAYARSLGFDGEDDDITRDALITEYGGE